MSAIPEDVRRQAEEAWLHASIMSIQTQQVAIIARAILAERERCAERLENLADERRKQHPKRYNGNSYILSCAAFIRSPDSEAQNG